VKFADVILTYPVVLLMDKIKTILIVIVLIFAAIGIILTAGFLYSLLQLLLLVGVVGLAGYIGIRLLTKIEPSSRPERQLKQVERTLEEYKRKLLK
jgi:fatty acid desaturase